METKTIKAKLFACMFLTLLVLPLQAQVTVGLNKAPEKFSVLELSSNNSMGLRLPQIKSTAQRDSIFTNAEGFKTNALAYGLLIFNMENNCIEYWNGNKWESLCLGTANITLTGDHCIYDPTVYAPADGTQSECTFTPKDNPECVVPSGQAYQVYLTAGAAYATLHVDGLTSAFSLTFSPNNSANNRIAVVRVVNNCSGEFQDFLFTQSGADCPANATPFSLQSNTTEICGNSGAAVVFVQNPQEGMNYIWEYDGVIVNTSNYMEITRPGKYVVYAGLLGCKLVAPQEITITENSNTSYAAPVIQASNSGILCNGGNVILTANNVTESVSWFHNGALYNAHTNPLTVSGASAAGEWFAVQQNGACSSRISNKITLIDQTSDNTALAAPVATVNGTPLNGNITACKGGTLELKVTNSYPAGTIFEWFDNGISISRGTGPVIYTVAPNKTTMMLSVEVSNNSGSCPNTAVSNLINVTSTAPESTTINNGSSTTAICGNTPAMLQALNSSGASYEWFNDGVLVPSANASSYRATQPGSYTVRFQDAGGCWSALSTPVNVVQSAPISLNWQVEPSDTVIVGNQESYTVLASPAPDKYTWTSSNTSVATVTPIDGGKTVSVNYLTTGTTTLKVTAENACGTVTLKKNITVSTGCTPITSVTITPAGTVTKALDENGNPKTAGDNHTTFTATATNGSPATSYEWYIDDVLQAGQASSSFTYNTPTGSATTHTVYAAAVNACTPSNTAKSAAVTVITTKDNPVDLSGHYLLLGKVCFDVKRSNNGGSCAPLNSRTDDFASTKSFSYKFSNSATFNNLTFELVDNNNLVVNTTTTNNIFTITFRNDINDVAKGRDKTTALKLTIVAKFKDNTGAAKQISLEVNVQDCTCGCTVKSAKGDYITFMCYNLGADEATKSMSPMEQAMTPSPTGNKITDSKIYGDLYQWGRQPDGHEKRTSAVYNTGDNPFSVAFDDNSQIPSTFTTYFGKFISATNVGDWHGNSTNSKNDNLWNFYVYPANNPCPPGWRIPTQIEWSSIMNSATPDAADAAVNNIPSSGQTLGSGNLWKWNPASNGTAGWLVSPDGGANYTLFLPAAGYRNSNNAAIESVGSSAFYWSIQSTKSIILLKDVVSPGTNYNRANGFSVRCIAE